LSGPVVLRLSAWGARELAGLDWHFSIMVNWLPSWGEQLLAKEIQLWRVEKASAKLWGKNHFGLPQRLWEFLLEESGVQKEIRWADLPSKDQNRLVSNLSAYVFQVKGKTTFREEFVTAGGVKLSEVDVNTMMSKKIPGLFFAGEILDVDGITGGFNFQHAWTSGFVAANAITRRHVLGNTDGTA
jgi:predicted Rossmann fold flavoprotein